MRLPLYAPFPDTTLGTAASASLASPVSLLGMPTAAVRTHQAQCFRFRQHTRTSVSWVRSGWFCLSHSVAFSASVAARHSSRIPQCARIVVTWLHRSWPWLPRGVALCAGPAERMRQRARTFVTWVRRRWPRLPRGVALRAGPAERMRQRARTFVTWVRRRWPRLPRGMALFVGHFARHSSRIRRHSRSFISLVRRGWRWLPCSGAFSAQHCCTARLKHSSAFSEFYLVGALRLASAATWYGLSADGLYLAQLSTLVTRCTSDRPNRSKRKSTVSVFRYPLKRRKHVYTRIG